MRRMAVGPPPQRTCDWLSPLWRPALGRRGGTQGRALCGPQHQTPAQHRQGALPSGEDKRVSLSSVLRLSLTRAAAACALAKACDERVLSGGSDHSVKVWDRRQGACVATLLGHRGAVMSVDYDLDQRVISGSYDSVIKVRAH